MPERHIHLLSVCTFVKLILYNTIYGGEPRCLATFGLTKTNIMDDTHISGDKWDVYSLAVAMSFLFSEQRPYSGLREAVGNVRRGPPPPPTPCGRKGGRASVCGTSLAK